MDIFAILNCLIFCGMGLIVLNHVRVNWDNEKKKPYRYSEIIDGVLFFVMGYMFLTFLDKESVAAKNARNFNLIIFIINILILIWIEGLNINIYRRKCKKNPELVEERNYDKFLKKLKNAYDEKSHRKDIIKDLTRKFLHIVILGVVFGVYGLANADFMQDNLNNWGLTPIAFRNGVYLLAAGFFVLMFSYADSIRLSHFEYCPDWAHKWYFKSLEPSTESYTYISSVPFLLSLASLLYIPYDAVIFSAAMISCIADAAASVIGKSFGDHKMENFGVYPEKSFEGMLAGAFSAYISVFLVFHTFHKATPAGWDNLLAFIGAVIFILIDAYGKAVADNILNTLIPAYVFWIILSLIF